jgi:DNA-directed RNA polymerase specialized sigma subunit
MAQPPYRPDRGGEHRGRMAARLRQHPRPVLRERIILAYLGLAERYRHSRGTTPDDLAQTARAALVAAIGYSQMHVSRLLRRALGRMRFQLVS